MESTIKLLLSLGLLCLMLPYSLWADTIYTYTGNPYANCEGVYYCSSTSPLSMSITLDLPLTGDQLGRTNPRLTASFASKIPALPYLSTLVSRPLPAFGLLLLPPFRNHPPYSCSAAYWASWCSWRAVPKAGNRQGRKRPQGEFAVRALITVYPLRRFEVNRIESSAAKPV
jgi:hypothetical protein